MKLVHFYLKVVLDDKLSIISSGRTHHNTSIDLTYNFSNESTPSATETTIYGLKRSTANKFKKSKPVDLYAGFYNSDGTANNIGHILHAKITTVDPLQNDSGDWSLKFTIQDGKVKDPKKAIKIKGSKKVRLKSSNKSFQYRKKIGSYSAKQRKSREQWLKQNPKASSKAKHLRYQKMENNIKSYRTQLKAQQNRYNKELNQNKKYKIKTVYKYMSFKPRTKGSAIIKAVAKKAGINISSMKLVYDRVYYNGYTANKKPLNVIKEVAKACQTNMFYQHGKLVIKSFAKNKKINYTCVPETGLITPPTLSEDSDSKGTYQATILFNPKITTGVIFRVTDKMTGFNDDVIVTSGSASVSISDTPTMDISFKKLSTYKKQQASSIKNKKNADTKKKEKRDQADKKKAIAKRKARTKKKKGH